MKRVCSVVNGIVNQSPKPSNIFKLRRNYRNGLAINATPRETGAKPDNSYGPPAGVGAGEAADST